MAEYEHPDFGTWLQKTTQTDVPSALFEEEDVVGAQIVYVWYERVTANMVKDTQAFDSYVKHKKEEVTNGARINGTAVKGVRHVVLKPEDLRVGDREQMFPQHAKFTNLVYFFGYTYNDDEQPAPESTEV